MSAQIIPFPGSAGKASKPSLRALVEIDQMNAFRVLGVSAMRDFGGTQRALSSLVHGYESSGVAPKVEELKELMWRYAEVFRRVDFADKFLVVHGEPIADADGYEELRSKYRREICHQSIARDVFLSEVLRGLDDD